VFTSHREERTTEVTYAIYYHRDGANPVCLYTQLSEKAAQERLTKMSQQTHLSMFYDGIVNEAKKQQAGYYYGEKDAIEKA
jgi:hypothetical protein